MGTKRGGVRTVVRVRKECNAEEWLSGGYFMCTNRGGVQTFITLIDIHALKEHRGVVVLHEQKLGNYLFACVIGMQIVSMLQRIGSGLPANSPFWIIKCSM